MKTFEITAGKLNVRLIRNTYKTMIFEGLNIEMLELKGFLESTFIFKGEDVDKVYNHFRKFLYD